MMSYFGRVFIRYQKNMTRRKNKSRNYDPSKRQTRHPKVGNSLDNYLK